MLKPKSISKNYLLLACLASLVSLTACGRSTSQTTTGQSSRLQESTSQSKNEQTETASTSEASSSSETTTQSEAQASAAASQEQATRFHLDNIIAGDYSSIAGTWANAQGRVFTVNAEGMLYFGETFDETAYHNIEGASLSDEGRVGGSLGFYKDGERQGGAHISIVPVGVPNILGAVSAVDHIEIGQSASAANPEEQFFRQD